MNESQNNDNQTEQTEQTEQTNQLTDLEPSDEVKGGGAPVASRPGWVYNWSQVEN